MNETRLKSKTKEKEIVSIQAAASNLFTERDNLKARHDKAISNLSILEKRLQDECESAKKLQLVLNSKSKAEQELKEQHQKAHKS